jgi:hypothetical protein
LTELIKLIVNKPRNIVRVTDILNDVTLTNVSARTHFFTASRTDIFGLQPHTLKLTITHRTKPRDNVKTPDTDPNRRMVQLIPSRTEKGLAFIVNLNENAILFTASIITVNKATATLETSPLASTALLSASDRSESVIVRTPNQTLKDSVNAESVKNHATADNAPVQQSLSSLHSQRDLRQMPISLRKRHRDVLGNT